MATLREYFDTDFGNLLSAHQTLNIQGAIGCVSFVGRLHFDFSANAKFMSCFVPVCDNLIAVCQAIANDSESILRLLGDGVGVACGLPGHDEVTDGSELRFTGRVFIYSESDLTPAESEALKQQAAARGIALVVRGPRYAAERGKWEKPLAFICHDSRDKDAVARPIAIGLASLVCPVWFDEFSLKVGDSLRESVEKGLKECKKCVLVLSPSFLSNPGWTKVEFNSIFTREIIENQKLVLPVWHGVTKREVFDYSPSLADRLALDWTIGEAQVVGKLLGAIKAA